MSSERTSKIGSKYLEGLDSAEKLPLGASAKLNSLSSSPTKHSISSLKRTSGSLKENKSPDLNIATKKDLSDISPVKRMILEKERALRELEERGETPFTGMPPKSLYQSTQLSPTKARNFVSRDAKTLSKINGVAGKGMSSSPSLKNLNKLKKIETKLQDKDVKHITGTTNRRTTLIYEYLCRILEAKNWIEEITKEKICDSDSILDIQEELRNGIALAKLTNVFAPDLVGKIHNGNMGKFQFKYIENISYFLKFLNKVQLPDLCQFETTDLYDMKNFPQVIFCIHSLSIMLSLRKKAPKMENLSGVAQFSDDEINTISNKVKGMKLPNFSNIHKEHAAEDIEELDETSILANLTVDNDPCVKESSPVDTNDLLTDPLLDSTDLFADDEFQKSVQKKYLNMKETNHVVNTDDFEYLEMITNLQAMSRGSLLRYKLFVDRFMLKSFTPNTIKLQGLAKGYLLRSANQKLLLALNVESKNISKLQTLIRNKQNASKLKIVNNKLQPHLETITQLQAIIRAGVLIRKPILERQAKLKSFTNSIISFQSFIKMKLTKRRTDDEVKTLKQIEPCIVNLQSIARNRIFNRVQRASLSTVLSNEDALKGLQSIIRGNKLRNETITLNLELRSHRSQIKELQTIARGGICRNRLNFILDTLYYEEPLVESLVSIARGKRARLHVSKISLGLQQNISSVITIQSSVRGVLSRFAQELVLDDLEYQESSVIALQSLLRARKIQSKIKYTYTYYNRPENVRKIIKVQSYLRTHTHSNAYNALVAFSDPPFRVVKSFIHLLQDNDKDFDEELEVQRMKDLISRKNQDITKLEEMLVQLDVKIDMLMKNKITLDELVKHAANDKTKKGQFTSSVGSAKLDEQLRKLDKPARDLIGWYEKFFYLLQTNPEYLTRLFDVMQQHGLRYEISLDGNIESYVLTCFNFSQINVQSFTLKPTREEFLLMELILLNISKGIESFKDDLEQFKKFTALESPKDLVQYSFVWEHVLKEYNNLTHHRIVLKKLYGERVKQIIDDSRLDLESVPLTIFRSIIAKEIEEHGSSIESDENMNNTKAIQDPRVRDIFVDNLSNLRELANNMLLDIEASVPSMPLYIRTMLKEVYLKIKRQFPRESERFYLSYIGKIFMKNYFLPILFKPEIYGLCPNDFAKSKVGNKKIRQNLIELARVMIQLVSMRSFSTKNVYLQPLNDFIEQSVELTRRVLLKIIDTETLEGSYGLSPLYHDIISNERPILEIGVNDLLSIVELVTNDLDVIAPSLDDYLRTCIEEMVLLGSSIRSVQKPELTLRLNPSTIQPEENSHIKVLWLNTKKNLTYIIQVQDSDDLLDMLIAPIEPRHDLIFQKLKEDELSRDTDITIESSNGSRKHLKDISFRELKTITLENVLKLESTGSITRSNCFQDLLNEIANDIKNKHDQRRERGSQLKMIRSALQSLKDKERQLQNELDSYNNDIEEAIRKLQSGHKKKSFLKLLFTGEFYQRRALKKLNGGSIPKFGSFKYSSKYLFENRILLEINGVTDKHKGVPVKYDFLFSCDEVERFRIEVANDMNIVKGGVQNLTLDSLLKLQQDKQATVTYFDIGAKFNVNLLVAFMFRKFYEVK
ncbi:Cytokinesis protein [Komagataella phaffii CBS 7435]|uniref:Cytokinesis protein n=1 Tax=Komagataella phaffii (strain ATCC 76273 / CBS 7435 / CECT 11047 / NRRL Y-11430 / Wegner 21-1) TaxID=981350 RepID=F2QN75_KOMPC|nr:GQ67_02059T0 [Komagataella phaffii]AOA66766.1 GQ68_02074T0 [Komagataella phaffii GS115]CAH2446770.1 Cytokinesis protein [Komagataella phaffii CBS 7435]CCA37030.1 Cytokinesis protein [Komagataella phaffii CBS 7435]